MSELQLMIPSRDGKRAWRRTPRCQTYNLGRASLQTQNPLRPAERLPRLAQLLSLSCCLALACTAAPKRPPARSVTESAPKAAIDPDAGLKAAKHVIALPQRLSKPDALAKQMIEKCVPDEVLTRWAKIQVRRGARGEAPVDGQSAKRLLTSMGSAHPPPDEWRFSFPKGELPSALERLTARLEDSKPRGQRYCGLALADGKDGTSELVAVVVDGLATFEDIPVELPWGTWLEIPLHLDASVSAMRAAASPPGLRKARWVSIHHHGDQALLKFLPHEVGRWHVQVLAEVDRGPEVAFELAIRVIGPSTKNKEKGGVAPMPAPGSEQYSPKRAPAANLLAMLNAERSKFRLDAVGSDPRLSGLAQTHAEADASRESSGARRGLGRSTSTSGRRRPSGLVWSLKTWPTRGIFNALIRFCGTVLLTASTASRLTTTLLVSE